MTSLNILIKCKHMSFDKILKPQNNYDLIRIGRDNDGGYLVEKKSLENSLVSCTYRWSSSKSSGRPSS